MEKERERERKGASHGGAWFTRMSSPPTRPAHGPEKENRYAESRVGMPAIVRDERIIRDRYLIGDVGTGNRKVAIVLVADLIGRFAARRAPTLPSTSRSTMTLTKSRGRGILG